MRILGIESSCDETAASVVQDGKILLSNVVFSSMDLHAAYGGVVPEIAARSHVESITPVITQALADADCTWDDIDGIAVTYGAGLGGSLLVGVMTARTLAITKNKPLYAINHVEAHIYANFLTKIGKGSRLEVLGSRETTNNSNLEPITYNLRSKAPAFPMLGLIVSGGHSQLVLWQDHFDYKLLGQTHDDAIGEAFDKVAKMLGLPYPGGPSIGIKAQEGDPLAYIFPKAKMPNVSPALAELRSKEQRAKSNGANTAHSSLLTALHSHSYDFSFSGVKTAVLRACQGAIGETHEFPSHMLSDRLSEAQKANIAASFERIAVETVVDKAIMAFEEFKPKSVVIGGGVAASPELRKQLEARLPIPIEYQDFKLMTDNGAMVATLGCYKAMHKQPTSDPYSLEISPNLSM